MEKLKTWLDSGQNMLEVEQLQFLGTKRMAPVTRSTACSGIVCKYAYLCMAEKASTSAGFPKCIKALISLKLIPEKENLLAVLIFDICNTEQLLHEGRCSAIVCNHNIIPFQGTVLQSIIPILV